MLHSVVGTLEPHPCSGEVSSWAIHSPKPLFVCFILHLTLLTLLIFVLFRLIFFMNNKTTMVLSFERSFKSLVGLRCPANQEVFSCLFTLLRPFILNLCTQASPLNITEKKKCLLSLILRICCFSPIFFLWWLSKIHNCQQFQSVTKCHIYKDRSVSLRCDSFVDVQCM